MAAIEVERLAIYAMAGTPSWRASATANASLGRPEPCRLPEAERRAHSLWALPVAPSPERVAPVQAAAKRVQLSWQQPFASTARCDRGAAPWRRARPAAEEQWRQQVPSRRAPLCRLLRRPSLLNA